MKQKLILLTLLLTCIGVQAIEVGEYMEIDETPCVVIYVDETGEHGLVMSRATVSYEFATKEAKRLCKEGGLNKADIYDYVRMNAVDRTKYNKMKKYKPAYRQPLFDRLMPLLGERGEENQKAIVQFCNDNGLILQHEFPDIAWADGLGEGWFIPGDYELELYAQLYAGGMREEHAMPKAEYYNRYRQLTDGERAGAIMRAPALRGAHSSTCKYPQCGFRLMTRVERDVKDWMQIFDQLAAGEEEPATVAMKRI
ncbi:MAG: hypothetical protein KBT12_05800 [Bacteroidales bacterium]|nr:hypothetical protein [Candidatus Physcousia equi]